MRWNWPPPETVKGNRRFLFGFLALLLAFLTGCGGVTAVQQGTRRVADAIAFSPSYVQRVALLSLQNGTFLGDAQVVERFQNPFLEALDAFCPNLSLTVPAQEGSPAELLRPPRQLSGRVDNLALAEIGRKYGVHAAIFLRDLSVESEERPAGMLMFRGPAYYVSVRVRLEVYSMTTGAKLVDEPLVRREKVDWEEHDAVQNRNAGRLLELPELMTSLSRVAAEAACDAIRDQPWRGFVVSVEEGRGILSSGREANLESGEELTLFSPGETIEGRDGQRFRIPGIPAGKVQVTEVYVGRAVVEPTRGETIEEGSTVGVE